MGGDGELKPIPDYRIETWTEPTPTEKFAAKYGCLEPGDATTFAAWLASPVPKSQPLRRLAALYLLNELGVTCNLCGQDIDPALENELRHPGRVQLDHIIPSSGGGLTPGETSGPLMRHATRNAETNAFSRKQAGSETSCPPN